MDDTNKMFRMIINGQSSMKSELLAEIHKVDKKVEKVIEDLHSVEVRLTKRIDKIGLQEASLEDDCPTRDEFDNLEVRVKKVEQTMAIA